MSARAALRAIRVVMFDLDGTLVDTMPSFADLAAEVMGRRHGADRPWARARYLETSGLPFCQQLESIFAGHQHNLDASEEFEARKRSICDATRMDARTVAGLDRLRKLGLKLVVSSNTGQAFVDDFGAREEFRFDLALGFDPGRGMAKGRPHVDRALAAFAEERERLLLVGDSLADAGLARAAGVAFVGRTGTFTAEQFRRVDAPDTVDNIYELPDLLG